jgi:hypothetical protein
MSKIIKLEIAFECPPGFVFEDGGRLRDFAVSAIMYSMYANPSANLNPKTVEGRVLMVVADSVVERKRS